MKLNQTKPKLNAQYFCPEITKGIGTILAVWKDDERDNLLLLRNMVYNTPELALEVSNKWARILKAQKKRPKPKLNQPYYILNPRAYNGFVMRDWKGTDEDEFYYKENLVFTKLSDLLETLELLIPTTKE